MVAVGRAGHDPSRRAPWAEPGGPRALVTWAETAATAAGLTPVDPARQVKTWNLSCVYRLPTSEGPVWAKAVPPFMCLDADVIETVRRYDPELAPAVLGGSAPVRHQRGTERTGGDQHDVLDHVLRL